MATPAAAADRQRQALQTIYSFFLGLMVLALIGIGVYTVYPEPARDLQQQIDKLYRQQEPYNVKMPSEMSEADREKRNKLQDQIDALQKKMQEDMRVWQRNTSIALIVLATAVMSISLIRSEQLRVLSNGLLLGGVFTMLYGVGWIIASGESWARLIVILFAFAITFVLGYLKFVRLKQGVAAAAAGGEGAALTSADAAAIETRLAAIEARLDAAGDALGGRPRD